MIVETKNKPPAFRNMEKENIRSVLDGVSDVGRSQILVKLLREAENSIVIIRHGEIISPSIGCLKANTRIK